MSSNDVPSDRLPYAVVLALATTAALGVTLLAPTLDDLSPHGGIYLFAATPLLFAVPISLALRAAGRTPAELGLTLGDRRAFARDVPLAILGALAVAFLVTRVPELVQRYPTDPFSRGDAPRFALVSTAMAASGLCWEFFYRGVWLLGLAPRLGARRALAAHLPIYVAFHAPSGAVEMVLAIPAGIVFGVMALRTRSVVAPWLAHVALSTAVNGFAM